MFTKQRRVMGMPENRQQMRLTRARKTEHMAKEGAISDKETRARRSNQLSSLGPYPGELTENCEKLEIKRGNSTCRTDTDGGEKN